MRLFEGKVRVRPHSLYRSLSDAQKLVGVDSYDEFRGLAAHKQLFKPIHDAQPNYQNLFLAQINTLKRAKYEATYFSLSILLN